MKKKTAFITALFCAAALILCSCGTISSSDVTRLEKSDASSSDTEPLSNDNELPDDGIITAAQMETIAGKEGTFTFSGKDADTGISYKWSYDGTKIQNPVDQHMKVTFPGEKTEDVKAAANGASVGLGIAIESENLAAPATLTITLTEKWDADTAVLCKLVDGSPQKLGDITLGEDTSAGDTTLAFSVSETGDTYYAVGGTAPSSSGTDNSVASLQNGGNSGSSTSAGQTGTASAGGGTGSSTGSASDTSGTHTCQISIECSTVLNNMSSLESSKQDFVPADGYILHPQTVGYTPGDSIYDVLYRVCRSSGIQIDASYTPVYSAYYIKGIGQLYEYDCGQLSGWVFSVNGWFPNYGCSKYTVSDGDVIAWRYTCDLGRDVGDSNGE